MFRGSYSKVNYDDSFQVSHGKESSEFNTTVVLRLDSKMKSAWTMLDHVNRSLYSSTTNIILANKPIFDEQKTILIKIDIAIQEIYSSGLTKSFKSIRNSKFLNIPILNDQTTFLEWNSIATDINTLIDELRYAIDKESTYENISGNNTKQIKSKKLSVTSKNCFNIIVHKSLFLFIIIFFIFQFCFCIYMLFSIDLSALTGNLRGSDTTTSTDTSSVGGVNKDSSIYSSIGNGLSTLMPTYRPRLDVNDDKH